MKLCVNTVNATLYKCHGDLLSTVIPENASCLSECPILAKLPAHTFHALKFY